MSMDSRYDSRHSRIISFPLVGPSTPSMMQREGKDRNTLDQPGADGRDDTPISGSNDVLDITPGDVVQTAGYGPAVVDTPRDDQKGNDDDITDPDIDSESSDSESDALDHGPGPNSGSASSSDHHLRNLCGLNVVTKGGGGMDKKSGSTPELDKALMTKKDMISKWKELKNNEYNTIYDKIKDYQVMMKIIMKCWDILGKLRDTEQLKDFGESIDSAMINIEYLHGLEVGKNEKEISNHSYLCDFIRDTVIGQIDDGFFR
eukprot:CAMPEP_0201592506 /NCGR_PEP_ID=MMETSP0190_2-20130828/190386_1 /ASSEMBLY_ACC=CAM_ASM_000263 /TAXON_ID=37353 /ORGANISM="Rosalina sp." /LENGTH=259 /DNA_ID=CAMNT_0048051311 /DNA_START=146 /DNA_END=925 /DNA_ORIENTATION=-